MNKLLNEIYKYAKKYSTVESEVLLSVRETTENELHAPQMISGHLQGRLLSMISCMIKPSIILEIGTFSGYSAICLAEGLSDEGILHTIDKNHNLKNLVTDFFIKAGLSNKVKYHIGNALDILPTIDEEFDLVFIDADKRNYIKYYEIIIDKVRKGGIVIVDNILWKGKVMDYTNTELDKTTNSIIEFTKVVHNDSRVENLLLPIRDGLMLLRKI